MEDLRQPSSSKQDVDSVPSSSQPSNFGYSLNRGMEGDIPGGVAPWSNERKNLNQPLMPSAMLSIPIPRFIPIPVVQPPFHFQISRKRITKKSDMEIFVKSEALQLYLSFIVGLSESIAEKKISDTCLVSDSVNSIVSLLEAFSKWVDEIPPRQTAVRYGNPAYRDWHTRLEEEGPKQLINILPVPLKPAVVELFPYLFDSFGNATRIDYGTGHEANFAAFLLCLSRLGILTPEDYQAVVSKVFVRYLTLMRQLQTSYWLEPAGSHGVWGLDDYHFLPFIFGASQFINHKHIKPKSIHNEEILENFKNEYLYLSCVQFVKKVKKGHFAEHSPMINDISGVPNWNKVYSGMLKMYSVEVMGKFPIMQHFLFGSLIPWPQ